MLRKAYDGTVDPAGGKFSGNWHNAPGNSADEAAIKSIRNKAIAIVTFFSICSFLLLFYFG
jgi:hypothetical protein